MSWFRIDDTFSDHPKVLALLEMKHGKGALALWTIAGSWCSRHLTDGQVPASAITRLGFSKAEADALVTVGLWAVMDGGYRYHDWAERNPLRTEIEEKRAATRERVTRHRDKRATERDCNALQARSPGDPVTPLPSRPVPTQERGPDEPARARPSSDLVSAIISGTREAFESLPLPPPKQTRAITWPGWHEIARFCEDKAAMDGAEPIAVAQTLVGRFLRDKRAKSAGYPLTFLAENPLQFWEAA